MAVVNSGRFRPPADLGKSVKVFDFFCGCGGTSQGLRAAGFQIALGLDNDQDAGQTFQENFPEARFLGVDIRYLPTRSLDRFVVDSSDHPLLFAACAPCQPFSKLTKSATGAGDKRFGLLGHVLRFARRHRPEFVLVENVPGLRHTGLQQGAFNLFVLTLRGFGYETEYRVVRCHDYGVPQRRSRLMLLASRIGHVTFPDPTHGPGRPQTNFASVRDWIGVLPPLAAGQTHATIPNHQAARLSELNLRRIHVTPPGGDLRDLPPKLVPASRGKGFKGYTDVYGRLNWNAPAPALTTRCISLSNGRYGHPEQDRALSVREAACLQTFPMDFKFLGSLNSQAKQIGNAVPVLLSQRFAEHIIRVLSTLAEGHSLPNTRASSGESSPPKVDGRFQHIDATTMPQRLR